MFVATHFTVMIKLMVFGGRREKEKEKNKR